MGRESCHPAGAAEQRERPQPLRRPRGATFTASPDPKSADREAETGDVAKAWRRFAGAPAAANPGDCPRRKRSPPRARISSPRQGFALFRRKRAPTIHIYPPLPWRGFPADVPKTAAFPATQANIETRRALAVVHWAESACHQHFVNAKSTAIFEHDNTRLKAAIPPKPRQHVHRFAVHAPHFAIFRPVVHICILEQVFV